MRKNIVEILRRLESEFGKDCSKGNTNRWLFRIKTDFGRRQRVYLRIVERTESGKDVSRFVASSPIGPMDEDIDLERILRHNYKLDVGAISISELKNDEGIKLPYLFFRASHLALTADYLEIWELIVKTGNYADKLEKEIFGRDSH